MSKARKERERNQEEKQILRQTDRQREIERLDFQVERFSIKSSHLLMGAEEAKRRGSSQLSQRLQSATTSNLPEKGEKGEVRGSELKRGGEREETQGGFWLSSPKD